MLVTTDPRTAVSEDSGLIDTTPDEVRLLVDHAIAAMPALSDLETRAHLLDALAAATTARREELAATAERETGLGRARLDSEVARAAFQFSLFAQAVREGSFIEAMIDHAADTPLGPGPDVRRMLLPLGPVAVFGSSNFPFAFSVLGGDTASAIAAGCPVIAKAHGSHLLTSALSFEVLQAAARAVGAPSGAFGIVFGRRAGVDLVRASGISAVGFTGSLGAANVLRAAIEERDDPIPFFGELSSINPLVISAGAARVRGEQIAQGLFTSFTGSAGQLCTKPGIAFVPIGDDGQAIVDSVVSLTIDAPAQVLLNDRIRTSFTQISGRLRAAGADEVARATATSEGFTAAPSVLEVAASELGFELAEECFGPMLVIARYESIDQVEAALWRIPKSLTTTIHIEEDERAIVEKLQAVMTATSGRVVFNGFPTGVRVTWAQQHGGPWPATNSQHTSVGVTAVRRFLRPVAWQNAPHWALPKVLRDGSSSIPRRIDGVLTAPSV
jgi:NADP-dependent aldehyde dehydrogenase